MTASSDIITCSKCGHRNPSWYAACENCGAHLSLAASDYSQKRKAVSGKPPVPQPQGLPVMAHALCGWPLILVAIGGAIGGALGAVAYGINVAIYKSRMPVVFKIILNLGVGASAIALWLIISSALLRK
jgi:hypothetical protein